MAISAIAAEMARLTASETLHGTGHSVRGGAGAEIRRAYSGSRPRRAVLRLDCSGLRRTGPANIRNGFLNDAGRAPEPAHCDGAVEDCEEAFEFLMTELATNRPARGAYILRSELGADGEASNLKNTAGTPNLGDTEASIRRISNKKSDAGEELSHENCPSRHGN